jgi:WD40 repeat protein
MKAHPKFGTLLASSSYDGKVLIWREQPPSVQSPGGSGSWGKVFDFSLHTASVNMVSWAPHESGCLLASASSDGNVSVLEFRDNSWTHQSFHAHGMGVNAVSWAPAASPGSLISANPGPGQLRRFATGGSDNAVKIWEYKFVNHLLHSPPLPLFFPFILRSPFCPDSCFEIKSDKSRLADLECWHSQSRVKELYVDANPRRPYRLGSRCCMVTKHSLKVIHCFSLTRQNGPHMDF